MAHLDAQPAAARLMPLPGADLLAIRGLLARFRLVTRAMLIWQKLGWLVAIFIAGGILVAFTDYLLRLPGWLRGGFLGLGAAIALWIIRTRVIPAARFSPSLTEFALRLERTPAGQSAGLEGVLASAVDLGALHEGMMAAEGRRLARIAREALARVRVRHAIRPQRALLASAAALAAGLAVLFSLARAPDITRIGLVRVMAPWAAAQWPVRTAVADATGLTAHPLGTALTLRGALLRSDDPPASTRIEARYRLIAPDGQPGPLRRVVLTFQDRPIDAPGTDALGAPTMLRGSLFERLIEPAALELSASDASSSASDDTPAQLEYTLSTRDHETAPARILLVRPPAVVASSATIKLPAYAAAAPSTTAPALASELGPGNDERATLAGVLLGSTVELSLKFNKPLPSGAATSPAARREWIAAALGEQFAALVADRAVSTGPDRTDFAGHFEGSTWRLTWTARESVRLAVRPVDQFSIAAEFESVFRVQTREDRPPEATVTAPAEAGEALPTATLKIAAEGRDDIGLDFVAAEWSLARRRADSPGAPPEPAAPYAAVARVQAPSLAADESVRILAAFADLSLESIGAKPGDELWITALAADRFNLDGLTHEPVRSPVRIIKIISADELVEQVWNELGAIRRGAIRSAEQQAALRAKTQATTRENAQSRENAQGKEAGEAREQDSITEAVTRQNRTVGQLRQRVQENNLKDEDIQRVLDQSDRILDDARDNASSAGGSLRRAQDAAAKPENDAQAQAQRAQAREDAAAEQNKAQQALEELAALLDQGQDAWSVRRNLERLLEEQRAIRDTTRALGEQTVGRSLDELTPAQRQQTAQTGEQQRGLSERAAEMTEQLRQQAEALRQQDPATAAALEEAARRAERNRLQEQMERAAREIEQNRQQTAGQQQDRAVEAMEQMLQEIQAAAKGRDEVLARELASLVESLDALIRRQQRELDTLTSAVATGSLAGLDAGMIALRANTLGVLEQARSAGRDARDAAALIETASASQSDAISALRVQPTNAPGAQAAEQASLDNLKAARAKAEKARREAQERSNQRERDELKKSYRQLLDAQIDVRDRTRDVAALDAGRRQRAAARELAPVQTQVRQRAAELLEKTAELGESELFKLAHDRFDAATARVASRLDEGEANASVISRQVTAIRILQGLIESLGEAPKDKDDLRENEEGQDQGGDSPGEGQGQKPRLIPESAELRLLRDQQAQALELTRRAAEEKDADAAQDAASLQRALFDTAKALLERLQQQAPGGSNGPRIEPKPAPQPEAPK